MQSVAEQQQGWHNALVTAQVAHARPRPKRNHFTYGVYNLALPLAQLAQMEAHGLPSSRFGLLSFDRRDHGARVAGGDLEAWLRGILAQFGVTSADGDIVLMTMPRVLGYVFNPVSFWFCLDRAGALRAVLAEVNNTFGDHHSYLCVHDDQRVIAPDDILRSDKVFHVSPFMKVDGHYTFRFAFKPDKLGIWIDYFDRDGLLLSTSITGTRSAMTAASLRRAFFTHPLLTLKVVALIHWQAIKLFIKGVRYVPRPQPPDREVSR